MNTLFKESVGFLMENNTGNVIEYNNLHVLLEDSTSPVTRKLHEQLFQDVLDKGHIDFGDIPKSQGDITKYKGYQQMLKTLETIRSLALESNEGKTALKYTNTVITAVENIKDLKKVYEKGFASKSEYVAIEYNSYVYLCVEATTSLIYSFVEYMQDPNSASFEIKITNNKLRADKFFFDQLEKFNTLARTKRNDYVTTLNMYCDNGKNNFIGTTALGATIVLGIALAIVPVTREVIYQIYKSRAKLSEYLEIQANFLEMNKASVEANSAFDNAKKASIIKKQQNLVKRLRGLSDKLRVKSAVSVRDKERDIKKDNKRLSLSNIRDNVSDSDFEIL